MIKTRQVEQKEVMRNGGKTVNEGANNQVRSINSIENTQIGIIFLVDNIKKGKPQQDLPFQRNYLQTFTKTYFVKLLAIACQ